MITLTNKRTRYKLYTTVLGAIGIFSIFIYAISAERYQIDTADINSSTTVGQLHFVVNEVVVQINSSNDDSLCQSSKFISMCSCDADRRGRHQNVIAYSLYGNFSNPRHFSRYVDPIKAILSNISESYPGIINAGILF